jgi:hypothetical protein
MTTTGTTRSRRPHVFVWALAGIVVVAVIVGVVVAAVRGTTSLDADSPEGVVQRYLQAVFDRDHATAVGYLSDTTAERCPVAAFRDAWVPDGLTADLDDVRVSGDRADVRVVLHAVVEPLPVDPTVTTTELFQLERTANGWRIAGVPWPLTSCDGPP